jgi:prepilin-type processing-associated H-X9-DG protein
LAQVDYGFNHYSLGGSANPATGAALPGAASSRIPAKTVQIKKPSSTIMLADSMEYGSGGLAWKGTFRIYPRLISSWPGVAFPAHEGTCNVAWADGHVSGESSGQGKSSYDATYNLYYNAGSKLRNANSFSDNNWDRN